MQYGNPVPHGKLDSSLEGATYQWFSVSGYYFDVMNTLHEFAASTNVGKISQVFFK